MDLNLKGRVVVVTGGASGIGRASALAFAGEGANVAIWDLGDGVLRSLGFSVGEPEPGTRVYKHAESGALLIFPVRADSDLVREHHWPSY
jgi:NAD(P)-dependent dehydrogenase (short-subunit alcohol dehydrogenase family)